MDYLDAARELATKAHYGQFRWDGVTPYITHPQAVACMLNTEQEKAVAWLHDTLEDTNLTREDLRIFPKVVLNAVVLLTKKKGDSYLSYLQRVRSNRTARRVKIADITHNLSDMNMSEHKHRYDKYQLALEYLKHGEDIYRSDEMSQL